LNFNVLRQLYQNYLIVIHKGSVFNLFLHKFVTMGIIDQHIEDLNRLCMLYNVEKMYLFGSVLTPSFNNRSDIDFLVKFKDIDLSTYFDNYMNFKLNLENLFGREVDLVEEQTLKNPILINSINKSKELVYG